MMPGSDKAKRVAEMVEALGAVSYGVTYYPRPYENQVCAWHFFYADGREAATLCAGFSDESLLTHPGGRVWGVPVPDLHPLSTLKGA